MTAETLFQKALIKPPEERAAFLDAACADQPQLRAAVEALLAAHGKSTTDLDKTEAELGRTAESVSSEWDDGLLPLAETIDYRPSAEPGLTIAGRYTLVQKIGEGGMGEVWVAKQTEPIKRKVALKLIKAGMDTRAVLQRFEQERQALALMDHPNIARVIDAGMTAERLPFFVMELVNGLALTTFCDEARLGIRERLDLFVPICHAVQHAHQKGIVHRDLKPSNILVTIIDGRGVPKVIDFGVAKATAGRLTGESLSTQFGVVVGTFEYMAPEQAGFAGEDIDTRADIYSLGVILYELLTGLRPIDAKRLKTAAMTEMFRIIKEEEPSKPSTRISTDESAPSSAALRHSEPKKLAALLRGDLDWVVMKCLEKQRERRYETANGLARDIQRYLANEVVEARPPSTVYRLRKFVRRNRAMVLAGLAVAAALLVGVVAFAWQALIATEQTRIARDNEQRATANFQLARQAVDDYLTRVSENTLLRFQPSRDLRDLRKQLLEDALKFYRSFIDQHEDDPALRRELARAYARVATITDEIGSRQDAMAGHSKALALRRALATADPVDPMLRVDVAETLCAIGSLQRSLGRSADSVAAYEEAGGLLDDVVRSHPDSREAMLQLAKVKDFLGANYKLSEQWDVARPLYDRATSILKHLVALDPAEPKALRYLAWSHYQIGNLLSDPRRNDPDFRTARAAYDEALSIQRRLITAQPREPEYPSDMSQCYVSLASLAEHCDRDIPGAIRYLEQALDLQKKVVSTHPTVTLYLLDLSVTYYNLAYQCSNLPGHPDVVKWYRESIAVAERLTELDPENVDFQDRLGKAVNNLGYNLYGQGETDEAVQQYSRAIEIHRRVLATGTNVPSHRAPLGVALENLGVVQVSQQKTTEALASFEAALAIRQKLAVDNPTAPDNQDNLAGCLTRTAWVLLRLGRTAEARIQCERAVALQDVLVKDHPDDADYRAGLSESLLLSGWVRRAEADTVRAVADWERAVTLYKTIPAPEGEQVFYFACCHASLSGTAGKPDQVNAEADRAMSLLRKAVDLGYRNPDIYRTAIPLDSLRSRNDFKKLMAELESKIGPKAKRKT